MYNNLKNCDMPERYRVYEIEQIVKLTEQRATILINTRTGILKKVVNRKHVEFNGEWMIKSNNETPSPLVLRSKGACL